MGFVLFWLYVSRYSRPILSVRNVISGFHCDVNDICALLGFYTPQNGNPIQMFWDNLSGFHIQGSSSPRRIPDIFLGLLDP